MDFTLTHHASEESRRRQIPLEWIVSTMAAPEQVIPGQIDARYYNLELLPMAKCISCALLSKIGINRPSL